MELGADVHDVYEPLPEMDREQLARLRAIIGFPDPESAPSPARPRLSAPAIELHDSDPPDRDVVGLLEEVDRKLEKLIEMGPLPIRGAFFESALVSLHADNDDLHRQMARLQASVDWLTHRVVG